MGESGALRTAAGVWDFIAPREKIINASSCSVGYALEQKHEILKRFEAVLLGGFDYGIYDGTRLGAVGSITEKPVLSADNERLDGSLGAVVADFEPPVKEEPLKIYAL